MKRKAKRIALILSDTLQGIGLQSLLSSYFMPVEIEMFGNMDEFRSFADDCEAPPYSANAFDFYFTDDHNIEAIKEHCGCNDQYIISVGLVNVSSENVLPVSCPQEELIGSIGQLLNRHSPQDDARHANTGKGLTPRETDILRLVVNGKINREIADELNISFHTVLSHRKNITAKLGIKSISGLTFYAMTHGIR